MDCKLNIGHCICIHHRKKSRLNNTKQRHFWDENILTTLGRVKSIQKGGLGGGKKSKILKPFLTIRKRGFPDSQQRHLTLLSFCEKYCLSSQLIRQVNLFENKHFLNYNIEALWFKELTLSSKY